MGVFDTQDAHEGVSAFLEKARAAWQGRAKPTSETASRGKIEQAFESIDGDASHRRPDRSPGPRGGTCTSRETLNVQARGLTERKTPADERKNAEVAAIMRRALAGPLGLPQTKLSPLRSTSGNGWEG